MVWTHHLTAELRRIFDTRGTSLWSPVAIAAGYYLGAKVGFGLTLAPVPVSILWPPNAILLAGLLLCPVRQWALVLAAVFAAHLAVQFQSGVPAAMVLSWYVSNCTEALIGAGLVRRFAGGAPTFETFRGTALFLACAGLAAPFLSSFLDAAFVVANGWGSASYATIWRTRFFSNVLAAITLVPVIVTTAERVRRFQDVRPRRFGEALAGLVALAALCWFVFVRQHPAPGPSPALLSTPILLLVAGAVRFGPWGASASILVCALVAIWGALLGQGPFVNSSARENALAIQMFLIVTWIPVMSLAAVIRERVAAEAKSRRSEEQLAMAIEAAQLGRWEWNITTGRLTWSEITRRIYEVPLDVPVSPATFEALVHPDDRPLIAGATADAMNGRDIDVEFRVVFPDGRIKWILSKGRTQFDEEGRAVRLVGIKVDVTERKLAELQIHEQGREMAHRSRVTVVGELSTLLAHEVNQPLAAILANASAARGFLLHDPPDLRELGEIVEAIAHDNRRAAAIISRFGTLLRRGDASWGALDVNDVIGSVIDVARTDIISHGVSLTKCFEEELPAVHGDAIQLQQVLLNLIINACDAMDAIDRADRRLVLMTGRDSRGGVRVSVLDGGPGLPCELLERVFDPFVTSKAHRLGLGLAISRSIISGHEGYLWAENRPEGGAAFTFWLPAAPGGA